MTSDKDFKRLVRDRMRKTGESYTTARAGLRPSPRGRGPGSLVGDFAERLYTRAGLGQLGAHLEARYGIRVRNLTELDLGVFRVDRDERPSWVARVFPADRRLEQVEGDASVLRLLAATDFPAERCALEEPVSELERQGVLVTELVPGANARVDSTGPTLSALGELLGRLHTLPDGARTVDREAGGWHHISPNGGGIRADVDALLPLIAATEDEVEAKEREPFDVAREQLRGVHGCESLPRALIHPGPCGANAVVAIEGAPTLVDWTGAGSGPRVLSLGALIASSLQPVFGSPPSGDLRRVDAIVAGYRTHVRLTAGELAELAPAIAGGGIVLDCWSYLFREVAIAEVARSIVRRQAMSERAAERAVEAFDASDDELTGWYQAPPPAAHPDQGALF